MSKTITPDKLASEITKILDDWRDVTEDGAMKGLQQTADSTVDELRNAKPAGAEKYGPWNDYLNDWTRTSLESKKGAYTIHVHNKKHYQLAHLLENGHALWNGGRARAFPHIAPVAEKAENQLLNKIKQNIQ